MDFTQPTKSRALRGLIIVLVLGVLAVVIYEAVTFVSQPQTRRSRYLDTGLQPVGVATVGRGDIRLLVPALGAVTPLTTVTVVPQIAGTLMSVGFQEGQLVHKGQFLAQIDPRPYEALLEQYRAQLAHDEAALKEAQMDLTRYQTLSQQVSIARQTYEDQVYVVKQDEGTVASDKALIKAQELNLTYCHIVAPSDGRVGLRLVDPGNYVAAGSSTGLVVLALLQPISVIFTVPEDSLPKILQRLQGNAKLPVTALDRANVTELGKGFVASIDNEVDTTTGTVKLRATFDNADNRLFPSQFVNVSMLLDTLSKVVSVPIAAVQRGAPGTYVYLVNPDNTVSVHPIKLGSEDNGFYEVVAGLAPGDRVVTDGADRLRDGAHVRIPEVSSRPGGLEARSNGADASGAYRERRRHRRDQNGQPADSGASPQNPVSPPDSQDPGAQRRHRWQQRPQQSPTDTPQ